MGMTPTLDDLDGLRHDLNRVSLHLGTSVDATSRGLDRDARDALARAAELLDSLIDVVGHWRDERLATARAKSQAAQQQALAPETPAPEAPAPAKAKRARKPAPPAPAAAQLAVVTDPPADPDPVVEPREMQGTVEQVGAYEVRTIGKRRFIRCPEVLCGKRVTLTDEETQFEVADTLHAHTVGGECLARAAAGRR